MSSLSPEGAEGERRRDAALALLNAKRPAVVRCLQRAAVELAIEHGSVTADDVRAVVPIPPPINPKTVGAAFGTLAATGVLRGVGHVRSGRKEAHARHIRLWHLADRAAALRWLAANPEYPDPAV